MCGDSGRGHGAAPAGSGDSRAGEWAAERRDIAQDFRRAFPGEALPRRARIGIMVDTDNTLDVTTSWFAAIRVSAEQE